MTQWRGEIPELGSVGMQTHPDGTGAEAYQRAYRVVGFEEGRSPTSFRLVMERIEWVDVMADSPEFWRFYNVPRR